MSLKYFFPVLALLLFSCDGTPQGIPQPLPNSGVVIPGTAYSLKALATEIAPGYTVSWSVVEPDGGSVSPDGLYTAPSCVDMTKGYTPAQLATLGPLKTTTHLTASWSGQGSPLTVEITVKEEQTAAPFIDHTQVTMTPGGQLQFKVIFSFTCHQQTESAVGTIVP